MQHKNVEIEQQKKNVEETLTELKSTQAQLIQSEKMASLGELGLSLAYDIITKEHGGTIKAEPACR